MTLRYPGFGKASLSEHTDNNLGWSTTPIAATYWHYLLCQIMSNLLDKWNFLAYLPRHPPPNRAQNSKISKNNQTYKMLSHVFVSVKLAASPPSLHTSLEVSLCQHKEETSCHWSFSQQGVATALPGHKKGEIVQRPWLHSLVLCLPRQIQCHVDLFFFLFLYFFLF
jgi:hypothetical protein